MLSEGSPVILQQRVENTKTCVKLGLQYFQDKLSEELRSSVTVFKAACVFLPQKMVELKPDVGVENSL